ncbi:MAG: DUF4230 domain-containing protein [Spirochaetaceae bacterium]
MVKRLGLTAAVFLIFSSCGPSQDERLTSLETKVRNLAELHTFEQTYRDVVYLGEQREFLFFRTMDRQLLFSVNIRVRAGVDLRQGVRVLPGPDRRSVYVEVPAPTILLVDADEESISQYFVRERGGTIGWLEVGAEIEAAKVQVISDAVDRGILDRAGENAREVLENVFSQAGFESVTITFGETAPGELEG